MKGNVIGFDPDANTGAISGHDGNRYDFVTLDWHGQSPPRKGDIVDFQAIERRATEIYLVEPAYVAPSLADFLFSPIGRISRSQYWLNFVLPYSAISLVLQIAVAVSGARTVLHSILSGALFLFWLGALWPSIAVLVKRVHDRDKSGWLVLILFVPVLLFSILLFVWIGAAIVAIAAGQTVAAIGSLGVLGVLVIGLGAVTLGINIWFFVEFGCLRGTVGANRFGPDPVR